MECVKKFVLIARTRSWSDVHFSDKREKLLSAIASSKRDKNVHAIFMHGDEPLRARVDAGKSFVDLYSNSDERWILQKEYPDDNAGLDAAIHDAKSWYPQPPYPIDVGTNQYLRSDHPLKLDPVQSAFKNECMDLCRAHIAGGGQSCLNFLARYAEGLKKTASQALNTKGGWVIDFCPDQKFLAELSMIEQHENIIEDNYWKTSIKPRR